jgi:hypothetical protein
MTWWLGLVAWIAAGIVLCYLWVICMRGHD